MNSSESPVPEAEPASVPEALPVGPDKTAYSESDTGDEPPSSALEVSALVVKVGGTLGGYRLIRKLGEGGMGLVFEAEDVLLRRRVALKVMKPEVAAKQAHRERFVREAQAAAHVAHDHIVPIFQVGEQDGIPFIAMPFLKGEPLNVRLKRGRLELPAIIAIGRQTAEGLAAAHKRGLIHRDIKPANIWLESSHETPANEFRVRILDFGLARVSSDQAHLTQSGAVMGTPAYMAPEQARGQTLDARADLFSLGCILYEMSTGKRPFTGPNTMAVLTSLALDVPVEPLALNPELPPLLSELIVKLLEKDPAKRFSSAQEVAETLRNLMPGNTVVVIAKQRTEAAPSPWSDIDASSTEITAPPLADRPIETTDVPVEVKPGKSAPKRGNAWLIGAGAITALLAAASVYLATQPSGEKKDANPASAKNDEPPPERPQPKPKDKKPADDPDNYALRFDGASQIEIPSVDLDVAGPFTLEAIVRPDQRPPDLIKGNSYVFWLSGRLSVRQRTTGNGWVFFYPNKGAKEAYIQSTGRTAGQRSHLAAVRDGSQFRLYVDGKLEASGNYEEPLQAVDMPKGRPRNLGSGFQGVIDEVRISKVARYEKDFTPAKRFETDEDTVALYHCDEGRGDVLEDSSGNDYNGKIVGATWARADGTPLVSVPIIDLIRLVNPAQDKVEGDWSVSGDGLECASAAWTRLALPYQPPAEYDYRIVFTRKSGNSGLLQFLSKDGRAFNWVMSGGARMHGFELIDGKDVFANGAGKAGGLENFVLHESIVQVRADRLRTILDGQLVLERKTDYRELSEHPKWALGNEKVLGLGSSSGQVVFHTIEVKEISGPGTFTRPDDPAAKKAAAARSTSGASAPPPKP